MITNIQRFLGPDRLRALFLLLAVTGLLSLILNAVEGEWVVWVQSILVLIFLVGAVIVIFSAMSPFERGRWLGILAPAAGLVILAVTVLPHLSLVLLGGAFGWILAGLFLFKPRAPMQYQTAIKALRKNEYAEAVKAMDELIRDEPNQPNHYRFRAEILRLWGKLDRARRDYRTMTELDPQSAVAYNGLAEVDLQDGKYAQAHTAALRAYELAPDEWVASYNLGMIEDRLAESEAAVTHLRQALEARVPDARHRLLIYFYLIRAYSRLGDIAAAKETLKELRQQRKGLDEWQTILKSDQAATLREVIADDVSAAEALLNGDLDVTALAGQSSSAAQSS
jgi:tetratricopeptide (TPR) repeat protein